MPTVTPTYKTVQDLLKDEKIGMTIEPDDSQARSPENDPFLELAPDCRVDAMILWGAWPEVTESEERIGNSEVRTP